MMFQCFLLGHIMEPTHRDSRTVLFYTLFMLSSASMVVIQSHATNLICLDLTNSHSLLLFKGYN